MPIVSTVTGRDRLRAWEERRDVELHLVGTGRTQIAIRGEHVHLDTGKPVHDSG
jgi:hypothetical protein